MKRKIRTIKERKAAATSFTLSRNCDDGEVLQQSISNGRGFHSEYVVQSSIDDSSSEEYIVMKDPAPGRYPVVDRTPYSSGQSADSSKTVKETPPKKQEASAPPAKSSGDQFGNKKQAEVKQDNSVPKMDAEEVEDDDYNLDLDSEEEDTFEKDIESLLKGKVPDKLKTPENRFAELQQPSPEQKDKAQSLDELSNQHAIFDQIAQSMQYAKAYDLGSIDLDKRFADFDMLNDVQKRTAEIEKKIPIPTNNPSAKNTSEPDAFDHEDFLRDLSLIKSAEEKNTSAEAPAQEAEPNAPKQDGHYVYESPSTVMSQPMTDYSYQQNPLAAIAIGDAIQIGLGAASIVQSQVSSTQGGFTLTCDYAQRLLTNEARQKMKGAQKPKQTYRRELMWVGELKKGFADASIVIEWEGNAYGEIGTVVIRRDIQHSTEWTKSTANITIRKIDRIPIPGSDPRTWPLVYTYDGTFDPYGNGYFEFSGEFEVNAFGGLKFVRHEVVNRSFLEFAKIGEANDYVRRGKDNIAQVPQIPDEQLEYLKTALP